MIRIFVQPGVIPFAATPLRLYSIPWWNGRIWSTIATIAPASSFAISTTARGQLQVSAHVRFYINTKGGPMLQSLGLHNSSRRTSWFQWNIQTRCHSDWRCMSMIYYSWWLDGGWRCMSHLDIYHKILVVSFNCFIRMNLPSISSNPFRAGWCNHQWDTWKCKPLNKKNSFSRLQIEATNSVAETMWFHGVVLGFVCTWPEC